MSRNAVRCLVMMFAAAAPAAADELVVPILTLD